jgi:hypothetical protein
MKGYMKPVQPYTPASEPSQHMMKNFSDILFSPKLTWNREYVQITQLELVFFQGIDP